MTEVRQGSYKGRDGKVSERRYQERKILRKGSRETYRLRKSTKLTPLDTVGSCDTVPGRNEVSGGEEWVNGRVY